MNRTLHTVGKTNTMLNLQLVLNTLERLRTALWKNMKKPQSPALMLLDLPIAKAKSFCVNKDAPSNSTCKELSSQWGSLWTWDHKPSIFGYVSHLLFDHRVPWSSPMKQTQRTSFIWYYMHIIIYIYIYHIFHTHIYIYKYKHHYTFILY